VNEQQRLLIVGGGCGAAPLHFLTQQAARKGWKVDVVLGARTKTELLYRARLAKLAATLVTATEDGSDGLQGTAVDGAKQLLSHLKADTRFAAWFACGPEPMLVSLVKLAKSRGIPLQLSLERYMKCGVGLCGHCVIDGQGTRVCLEGPVFDAKQLRSTDFGKSNRDATGLRQPLLNRDGTCSG
jgi:dihydroorotate dehydrogenase electron transfer subunit